MTILTLEEVIIKGILQRIEEVFDVKDPLFITSSDRLFIQNVIRQRAAEKILLYPFCGLKLTGIGLPQTVPSYNPKALMRHGRTYSQPDDSTRQVTKIETVPVEFQFELTYVNNDTLQVLRFANRWLFAHMRNSLFLTIRFYGMDYDIKVMIEPSLQIPEKDASVEIANTYEVVGNLIVTGYMTDARELSDMPKVDLLQNVTLTRWIGTEDDNWAGAQRIYVWPTPLNGLVEPQAETFNFEVTS
jgi:hypothetical protein